MRPMFATVAACCALLLAAGCGSSGNSNTGSGAGTTTGASATTDAGTPTGTSTTGGGTNTATSSSAESVKVDTTPKFAAPASSAPVQSGVVQIAYRNIAIEPDTLRVKVGTTVKWTNYDSVQANVTSIGKSPQRIASKNFGEGGTFEVKLEKPGLIHYESTPYPVTMNGTIEVVA
jgi:plastocyanin